eukprot:GAHX01002251.1.p1 GENE.GAHX01002251.1~~GAHX01002251.1.p1  ORF type:complete len:572 (-),score=88.98 GAHX01002251.1:34-1749(-)
MGKKLKFSKFFEMTQTEEKKWTIPNIVMILVRLCAVFIVGNFIYSYFTGEKFIVDESKQTEAVKSTKYFCKYFGNTFNVKFYISPSPYFASIAKDKLNPIHTIQRATFYQTIEFKKLSYNFISPNTDYYLHISIRKNPAASYKVPKSFAFKTHITHKLTRLQPVNHKPHRLLFSNPSIVKEKHTPTLQNFWLSKINLRLLNARTLDRDYLTHLLHLGISPTLHTSSNNTVSQSFYDPFFYIDKFWVFDDDYLLIHPSQKTMPLKIAFSPIGPYWLQLQTGLDNQWRSKTNVRTNTGKTNALGELGSDDLEQFKRMIGDNNLYVLIITFIVTVLHSIFEFMAFKHDIKFWNNIEALQGISIRTIYFNIVSQTIISFYLLRNETSPLIVLTSFIGLFIEVWKISKAIDIKVTFKGLFPLISIKYKECYKTSKTEKYDKKAVKWLSIVLLPLVVGYSIYSLLFEDYESWIDWLLISLAGSVYMFGFILMCPQVYINYKMKSVAHMPGKMLMYKFLNTIIDDLFSWVIKMPLLSRLACLRDDVIFLIYLYQRRIYTVDYERENEFGYKEEKEKLD